MDPTPVTVLGLGTMGTALAGALLDGGHPTTVWNRSAGRADALVARGAAAAGLAEAVEASEVVVLCVSGYPAVREILDALGNALSDRLLVNLTTGTPEQARDLARWAEWHRARYLDGVVQAFPHQVGTPEALLLYGGERAVFEEHEATLRRFGTATHLGADPGLACLYDLAMLGLWYEAQLGYLRALALVTSAGLDPEAFAPFAARQLDYVRGAAAEVAGEVRDRRYPPGPAPLAEHARVLADLVEMRRGLGLETESDERLARLVDARIALAGGAEGLTGLIESLGTMVDDSVYHGGKREPQHQER
ncbi:NAD(P)-dependent oxidoreductase [Pseudonocardia acaciae]|uniref:NAD(P)-dependent oxidoreductase n=1 Tax=Pseudonocardia acaciae TaxID=551276 RepID=UPI0007E8CF95|nr:NAD(P)-binding domain-containing protein [Pseudonocardia acaciae]